MSATSDMTVESPPPKKAVEILYSTSDMGILFEKYMARFAKAEIDARFAALVAFFTDQEVEKRNRKTWYSRDHLQQNW